MAWPSIIHFFGCGDVHCTVEVSTVLSRYYWIGGDYWWQRQFNPCLMFWNYVLHVKMLFVLNLINHVQSLRACLLLVVRLVSSCQVVNMMIWCFGGTWWCVSAVASPDGGWWLRWKGHPLSRCPHTLPWCPHTPAPLSWCPTPLLPTVPSYYLYSSLQMALVLAAYTPAFASLGAVLDGKIIIVIHLVLPGLFPYSHLEPVGIWKK